MCVKSGFTPRPWLTHYNQLLPLVNIIGSLPIAAGSASSTNPIQSLRFHPAPALRHHVLFVQTADKAISVMRIRSAEELAAKRLRRRKREREKAKAKANGTDGNGKDEPNEADEEEDGDSWSNRVTGWCVVRATGKIRSFSLPEGEEAMGAKGMAVGRICFLAILPRLTQAPRSSFWDCRTTL